MVGGEGGWEKLGVGMWRRSEQGGFQGRCVCCYSYPLGVANSESENKIQTMSMSRQCPMTS
jgi:hypothetical protein